MASSKFSKAILEVFDKEATALLTRTQREAFAAEVRGCARTVQIWTDTEIVAKHPRHTRSRLVIDPRHSEGSSTQTVEAPVPLVRRLQGSSASRTLPSGWPSTRRGRSRRRSLRIASSMGGSRSSSPAGRSDGYAAP